MVQTVGCWFTGSTAGNFRNLAYWAAIGPVFPGGPKDACGVVGLWGLLFRDL